MVRWSGPRRQRAWNSRRLRPAARPWRDHQARAARLTSARSRPWKTTGRAPPVDGSETVVAPASWERRPAKMSRSSLTPWCFPSGRPVAARPRVDCVADPCRPHPARAKGGGSGAAGRPAIPPGGTRAGIRTVGLHGFLNRVERARAGPIRRGRRAAFRGSAARRADARARSLTRRRAPVKAGGARFASPSRARPDRAGAPGQRPGAAGRGVG